MKTIDLSKTFQTMEGDEVKIPTKEVPEGVPLSWGRALTNILMNHRGKKLDQFKLYSLGKKTTDCQPDTEFDESDFRVIKEIILADETYSPLINGQLLAEFQ